MQGVFHGQQGVSEASPPHEQNNTRRKAGVFVGGAACYNGFVTHKNAPWLALTLGTLGLVVGYGLVVLSSDTAFASAKSCPFKEKCQHGGCEKHDCADGDCGADCPGCHKNV